jgi:hypothetical protein
VGEGHGGPLKCPGRTHPEPKFSLATRSPGQ